MPRSGNITRGRSLKYNKCDNFTMKEGVMPINVIHDCDPGHDDAVAMLLAIGNSKINLLGVTTVGGNQSDI